MTTPCWVWTGNTNAKGYGQMTIRKETRPRKTSTKAHRISYRIHKGEIEQGLYILHSCHNPPCVNPDHLRAGTPQENMDDMVNAGRLVKSVGTKNGLSKRTELEVIEIRLLWGTGLFNQETLGEMFNTSKSCIRDVCARITWKHIP